MIHSRCQQCGAQLPQGTLDDLCPFCVEEDQPSISSRMLGNCEVYEEIGRGGMGIVWRGRQRALHREVAIKTLPGGDLAGAEARTRFRTEAQAVARLNHPGIVTVYDVGEEDGMPYIVMELVHGRTLSSLVAEQPLTVQIAARLLRDTALAVNHAHEQGVMHRDLKPSNIMVEYSTEGGKARVMDFGLAKLTDVESSLTLSRSAAGSPAYMSPEQARGEDCTSLTDIYGLGAVLYASLTGRAPHAGESLATIMDQVQREEPVAARRLNTSVPADLDTICSKCLEKSPARRYPNAQALAEDLQRFLNGEPVHARPVSVVEKSWRMAKRRPWHAAAVFMAVTLLVGIMFSLAWKARTEQLHKQEVSRLLMASQLSEARTILRLQEADSRPQAETIVREILATDPPDDVKEQARDIALAAAAMPSASIEFCEGHGVVMNDWTLLAGDLPRDRWALATFAGKVSLRQRTTDQETSTFDVSPRKITAILSFSPGGRWLAIRHGEELGVWDTSPGAAKPLVFVANAWPEGQAFNLNSVAFSPDDQAVLWMDGKAVVATSLPDGREISRLAAIDAHCVAFDPSGQFFVLGINDKPLVELRRWPDGSLLQTLTGVFPKPLHCLSVAGKTGHISGGDFAGRVTVWKQNGREEALEFRGHTHTIRALGFSADGRYLASVGEDGTSRLWDCDVGEPVLKINFDAGRPSFSSDLSYIGMGCKDGRVGMIHTVWPTTLHRFKAWPVTNYWQTVAIHPDGKSLACLVAEGFALYRLPDGQHIRTINQSQVHTLAFDPSGKTIVASGREIHRYSLEENAPATQLYPTVKYSWDSLQATTDGQWMAAIDATYSRFVMWPLGKNSSLARDIILPSPTLNWLSLSPDGSQCAGTSRYDPGLRIFETLTGKTIKEIGLPTFHAVQWSPDGNYLMINGPTTALWDTKNWATLPLPKVKPTTLPAGAIRFFYPDASGNCATVAVIEDSHTITLISLATRQRFATLESPSGHPIYELPITPDNRWLIAATAQGQIHLWDLEQVGRVLRKFGSQTPEIGKFVPD